MRLIKKLISILTITALAASLTACDSDTKSDSSAKYTIGICQFAEYETLNSATEGFKAALTEKLGKDNIKFEEQNAQGDETNCSTICKEFVTDNADLILANATGALLAATQATDNIPVLGTSITDYGTALNITDWTGKTGTNVSGTSDLSIDQQEDMIVELFPNIKQVGILYCSSETNSVYQSDLMKQALDEDNIKYTEYTITDSNEIESITVTACNECDVLYIPTDSMIASNVETIKNIILPAGTPMITGGKDICDAGVATLSIDYYSLGYKTGEMAYEILENGKNPGDMEIEFAETYTKMYNEENCKTLNIAIPDDYEKLTFE